MKKIIPMLLSVLMLGLAGCSANSSSDTSTKADSGSEEISSTDEVKEPKSIKLMCFGDSITEGFTWKGSYRDPLASLLEENNYSQYVDFVGKKSAGDGYDPEHCGLTGYAIAKSTAEQSEIGESRSGITTYATKFMEDYTPDVVILQIGTNDILSKIELDNAGERLETLVDLVLEKLPDDGMLYLATIPYMDATNNTYISADYFTVESMDQYVDDYNDKIKALADQKQAEGKNVTLADVNSAISKDDLQDGVHPNKEGYNKLGQFWYDIISDYITNE